MLDLRRIRTEPDAVKAALARRGDDGSSVDEVLRLDADRRARAGERDDLRARVNAISKEVGALFRDGKKDEAAGLQAESKAAGEREKQLDAEVTTLDAELRDRLLRMPNLPSPDAPDGASEADNPVLRTEGYDPDAYGEHQRVPHWDIGAELGWLDPDAAGRISGAMFSMYRGPGARLLRAMVQLSLDRNGDAYEEIRPPTLVRTDTMVSTGHLPKFEDEAYHMERDDLWAIPTAEVPLTSLGRDQILDEADLPLRFMAYTSCYRREAGSAGRDTRGVLRSHEFDKVELLAYAANAEQAIACQEDVLARSESILADLGLAYRVVDLCTGDLGNSAARTWDVEAYAPGCDMWLEVSSVSWFSDYQARRANIRFRPAGGGSPEVIHTVNGSAMGWPRTWAAVVETHRQPDGTIRVPKVLQPYMGGVEVIGRR
ncbi:serine--tRNA ligase [Actinomarinicola tropica]|uniref:Serine--tRNA ligase n=1 Tax=Actinomarinicola tropica TaxID=2789776 RepID=A0A5Q2RIP6_9ACTN|nr:serine--tRNA ligase [Actinomarinicola tropica]QGG93710.1 serine--tRNA ligase [Actinomarinicola tropica]